MLKAVTVGVSRNSWHLENATALQDTGNYISKLRNQHKSLWGKINLSHFRIRALTLTLIVSMGKPPPTTMLLHAAPTLYCTPHTVQSLFSITFLIFIFLYIFLIFPRYILDVMYCVVCVFRAHIYPENMYYISIQCHLIQFTFMFYVFSFNYSIYLLFM